MSQDQRERPSLPYLPGLDGLRGAALATVLVYHLDRTWLPGGVLGMTVFFTLSGFLITTLILREIDESGRLDLRAFWLRRARRLAPAAVAAVGVIAVLVRLAGAAVDRTLIGDAVGSLTWTANWRFIASGSSYAQVFEHPSPFQHFWSLAIEEQLYLVLPLLALALLGGGRRRWLFATVLVVGVAASTAAGVVLHGGGAPSRAYFGTDARIAEPLVGALLAIVMVRARGLRRLAPTAASVLGMAAVVAVAVVGALMWNLSISSDALYRGGFLLTALLSALIVAAATQETPLARLLSFRPLVGLGRISYGVYLFHWPLFLFLEDRLRDQGRPTVIAAQLLSTFALAIVSYGLLELPIRRSRRNAGIFAVGWANASVAVLAAVAVCAAPAAATVPAVADLGPSVDAAVPPPPTVPPPAVETARAITPAAAAGPRAAAAPRSGGPTTAPPPVDVADDPIVGGGGESSGPAKEAPEPRGDELRVVVIGDSLGHNLGVGLTDWAEARSDVLVYNLAIAGCPLSRGGERRFDDSETFQIDPKCGWWSDDYSDRSQELASFDPDVIVVADGLNELLDRRLPEWSDWRRPGDPSYHEWLLSEYGNVITAMRDLAGSDTGFLFLNAPCADFERLSNWRRVDGPDDRVMALDRSVYPVIVGANQGDLFSELCPNGQYADTLWGVDDARPDGIHLSDEASDELARRWLGPKVLEVASANDGPPVDLGG